MFCPSCHKPNPVGGTTCHACNTGLPDRRRVFIGEQFVLLSASADHPIAIGLDDGPPVTVSKPTIISRHRHGVAYGDTHGGPSGRRGILRRRRPVYHFPLPYQPRLDAPVVDLTAVVTERRVYHPEDKVHIFIVAPDHAGGEVELEVRLAGQTIMREPVTLNAAGVALFPYADLEEGEYSVHVQRAGRSERAECRFSVAEFTLSPLIATLRSHTFAKGMLQFRLFVQQLSIPYTGEADIGLQCRACNDQVVHIKQLQVQEGAAASEFDLRDHDGPFKLQVTTPQGETAVVDLPGSGAGERERIVVNPLGRMAEASLLPGDDTQPVRGMHIGYGDVNAAPLRLESAVAKEGRFIAAGDYSVVQIVAHNPLSGESAVHEWQGVARGDRMTAEVNPPFTLFTLAAATSNGLHESWSTVVRPPDLEAALSAPTKASPGEHITVNVSATPSPWQPSTIYCLLMAYDARLEHESPLPKLGQRQYQAIRDAGTSLRDGPAPDATEFMPPMVYRSVSLAMAPAAPRGRPNILNAAAATLRPAAAQAESDYAGPTVLLKQTVDAPALFAPPTREDFPELAHLELFEFRGQAERVIRLGDQIGTWRCRAYLVSGLDLVELTADVQAEKALYAELDLPAIVAEGDEIEASVTYHSESPAEMIITVPGGETVQGMIMGHGTERVKLTGPGEVDVQLSGQAGQDWTARTVKAPGVHTVTASRLELLRASETVTGQRVVVYPGIELVLTDTIEALLRYPFG